MKAAAKPALDHASLVARHLRSLELGKKRYKQSDAALELLVKELRLGEIITLSNGRKFRLVDRYATKTTVFQPCGVRRYQFEEVTEP